MATKCKRKNISKKAERKLKLCRKEKACNLRINEQCKSCEYIEICQNNRQERLYILEEERKAKKINKQHSKARAAKVDDLYDNEVALDDSYDENDESCDENTRKCHPYEFACPYCEECIGNRCLYE